MNEWLVPFAFIASASRERRGRLTEALLPTMIPGETTQRVAIATVTADQQIRSAERREENVVNEVASAMQAVVEKEGTERLLTDAELRTRTVLSEVVSRRPDIRDRINATGHAIAERFESILAEETVKTIELIYDRNETVTGFQKLKEADLSSEIIALLDRTQLLSRVIDVTPENIGALGRESRRKVVPPGTNRP